MTYFATTLSPPATVTVPNVGRKEGDPETVEQAWANGVKRGSDGALVVVARDGPTAYAIATILTASENVT